MKRDRYSRKLKTRALARIAANDSDDGSRRAFQVIRERTTDFFSMIRERARTLGDFTRIAGAFAATLRRGDAVGLSGELGSGKTTFIRAAVEALQGADPASSPTFTFRHRYPGPPVVEHLDLFRLESPSEAIELGLHEAFSPEAIVFVEWPERLPGLLPAGAARVTIRGSGDAPREIAIEGA